MNRAVASLLACSHRACSASDRRVGRCGRALKAAPAAAPLERSATTSVRFAGPEPGKATNGRNWPAADTRPW